jgi:hypothetical protein
MTNAHQSERDATPTDKPVDATPQGAEPTPDVPQPDISQPDIAQTDSKPEPTPTLSAEVHAEVPQGISLT